LSSTTCPANAQNGDRHPGHRADYPVVTLRAEVLRGGPHGRRREGLKRFQRRRGCGGRNTDNKEGFTHGEKATVSVGRARDGLLPDPRDGGDGRDHGLFRLVPRRGYQQTRSGHVPGDRQHSHQQNRRGAGSL
jgi:hypothetical protein